MLNYLALDKKVVPPIIRKRTSILWREGHKPIGTVSMGPRVGVPRH